MQAPASCIEKKRTVFRVGLHLKGPVHCLCMLPHCFLCHVIGKNTVFCAWFLQRQPKLQHWLNPEQRNVRQQILICAQWHSKGFKPCSVNFKKCNLHQFPFEWKGFFMHQSMNLMQELRLFLMLVHIYEAYNTARYAVLTASNKCFPLSFFISHALIEERFARRVSLILLPKKNFKGFIFSSFHPNFCYSQLIAGKENLYSFFPSVSDWLHSVRFVSYGGCLGLYLGGDTV